MNINSVLVFSTPFSQSRALLVLLALARGGKNESIQQLQQYFMFNTHITILRLHCTQSSMANKVGNTQKRIIRMNSQFCVCSLGCTKICSNWVHQVTGCITSINGKQWALGTKATMLSGLGPTNWCKCPTNWSPTVRLSHLLELHNSQW